MSGRAIVERYAKGLAANDPAVLRECLHPDYVGRYPQSGEVIRGPANLLAISQHYPGQEQGSLSTSVADIRGRDDEFITTPSWSIVHLTGSGRRRLGAPAVRSPSRHDDPAYTLAVSAYRLAESGFRRLIIPAVILGVALTAGCRFVGVAARSPAPRCQTSR